jgi:hypothetical protein
MRFALAALLLISACHDHDGHSHGDYDTFQACFDEHKNHESLTTQQSIVVCCLDHPISGATEVCGADAAACTAYLTANLSTASASQTEVTAACDEYVVQKGM